MDLFSIYWLILALIVVVGGQRIAKDEDLQIVRKLKPLKQGNYVMFWRPQKVGSSTLLSILMSYSYRYNFLPKRKTSANSFCRLIAQCAINSDLFVKFDPWQQQTLKDYATRNLPGSQSPKRYTGSKVRLDSMGLSIPWKITLSHEICNLNRTIINEQLQCAFHGLSDKSKEYDAPVSEIFMVREPLSRAISVYYFWGELYKLVMTRKQSKRTLRHRKPSHHRKQRNLVSASNAKILGSVDSKDEIEGSMFRYHGSELTVPPLDIAVDFAKDFPYRAGMPGPSFTWSAFSDNYQDAIAKINSPELFTVVVERMDESLVVLSHHLKWSIADVVVTKQRKALSQHPKVSAWPIQAVDELRVKLNESHEFQVYEAGVRRLDERISQLKASGVPFEQEVTTLKLLRDRVTKICLNDTYLEHYRKSIASTGLPLHPSNNKLRDVEQKYQDGGHIFSFNREIVCSFDVCGACEAHSLLVAVEAGLAPSVDKSLTLFELPDKLRSGNINFQKCPHR